ncbi:MAG TPA: flagellar assembly protein FliW [Mycobacteriales bacterium]|nr:flagellar assembly protein FliW [Mycobacteriales bacterium]
MGEAATGEVPSIRFRRGLPGFPGDRSFCLLRWGSAGGVYSVLVDPAEPNVRFLVVPPGLFFPSYEIELDDATVAQLGIESADEVLLLVIVTVHERPEDATANLLGPIVINTNCREGLQLVLPDPKWGTRVPLLADATPTRDSQASATKEPARCSS